jgi:heat shock protein HslJ
MKVSGNTSCNSYQGKVSVDDTSMHFNEALAVTEMMCADGDKGERTYLEMLRKTNHYSIKKDTLQLLDDTLLLMRFIKK